MNPLVLVVLSVAHLHLRIVSLSSPVSNAESADSFVLLLAPEPIAVHVLGFPNQCECRNHKWRIAAAVESGNSSV